MNHERPRGLVEFMIHDLTPQRVFRWRLTTAQLGEFMIHDLAPQAPSPPRRLAPQAPSPQAPQHFGRIDIGGVRL